MAEPATLSVEGQNCCFWIKNSDKVSQGAYAGIVIVAALATIAILGGVLLVLAQRGFDLGALNAIARQIPAPWIYGSWFVSMTALIFPIVFIVMLCRRYREQVFSENELEEMQVLQNIKETIGADLQPMHFSISHAPASEANEEGGETPAVFILCKRDQGGNLSLVPFRSEEPLSTLISQLRRQGYAQVEGGLWVDREMYTLEEIRPKIVPELLERKCKLLSTTLPEGFFNWEEIHIKEWSAIHLLFAANKGGKVEYCIVQFTTNPKEKGAERFPDLINFIEAQKVVREQNLQKVRSDLTNGSHSYEAKVGDKVIYATSYKGHQMESRTEFFIDEKARNKRLKELGFQ